MADTTISITPPAQNTTSTTEPPSIAPGPQTQPQEARPNHSQPALATSKRKFHQILENLTKPSQSSTKRSLDSSYSYSESPAKRIRQEARARLEASSIPTRTAPAQFQSQLLRSRLEAAKVTSAKRNAPDSLSAANGDSPSPEPNYVPWSHEAFLRRLQTFADISKWSSKPDDVNEVAWARRGWVCVGANTVACKGGCEQRVVVGLRPKRKDDEGREIENSENFSAEIDDELVKRVAELIVSGHEDGCLWKGAGCRDDIYRLPITRPVVWQPQLRDRYLSFAAIASKLPPSSNLKYPVATSAIVNLLPPDLLKSPESVPPTANSEPSEDTEEGRDAVNHSALAFALLGWSANLQSPGYPLASCSHCFRRLGLWLYNRTTKDLEQEEQVSEPMRLDLIENHRDYCPWINPKSQAMPGAMSEMPAWQVLKRSIENDAGFRGLSRPSASIPRPNSQVAADGESHPELSSASPAPSTRSKEDIEKEDQARFAKLKELSKAIGLKRIGLREKLGKLKPSVGSNGHTEGHLSAGATSTS